MYLQAAARREKDQAARALMLGALSAQGTPEAIQDTYKNLTASSPDLPLPLEGERAGVRGFESSGG